MSHHVRMEEAIHIPEALMSLNRRGFRAEVFVRGQRHVPSGPLARVNGGPAASARAGDRAR